MERLKHQQSLLKIRKLGHYISKVLAELKAHELVECINSEVRKGRLYRLTDKGDELVKNLRWRLKYTIYLVPNIIITYQNGGKVCMSLENG